MLTIIIKNDRVRRIKVAKISITYCFCLQANIIYDSDDLRYDRCVWQKFHLHIKLIETFQLAKYKFENLCIRIRKINQNIQVLQ